MSTKESQARDAVLDAIIAVAKDFGLRPNNTSYVETLKALVQLLPSLPGEARALSSIGGVVGGYAGAVIPGGWTLATEKK